MTYSPVLLHLRRALADLNDPEQLAANPLADRLPATTGDSGPLSRAAQLRRLIVGLIEDLKPDGEAIENSPQWRQYVILYDRYVARRPLWQVEQKLLLGERQVRREHRRAVAELSMRFQVWLDSGVPVVAEAGRLEQAPQDILPDQPLDTAATALTTALTSESPTVFEAVQRLAPEPSVFSLRDLLLELQSVASEVSRHAGGEAHMASTVEPPELTVYTDRGILHQLLFKLIQALAQTRSEEPTRVRLSATQSNGLVNLVIQSDASLSDDDEALRLCRWLAQSLQTELTRQPGEGGAEGAAFWLALPAGTRLRKVMIVDDEPVAIELFESYLVGLDFSVTGVTKPGEALQRAIEMRPDAVVLDVMMPTMDGWELLQQLRHAPGMEGVPIIACSVLQDADLAHALGAASFLHKPVLRHQLIAALDSALGRPGSVRV